MLRQIRDSVRTQGSHFTVREKRAAYQATSTPRYPAATAGLATHDRGLTMQQAVTRLVWAPMLCRIGNSVRTEFVARRSRKNVTEISAVGEITLDRFFE
jgi:hypothetical protein